MHHSFANRQKMWTCSRWPWTCLKFHQFCLENFKEFYWVGHIFLFIKKEPVSYSHHCRIFRFGVVRFLSNLFFCPLKILEFVLNWSESPWSIWCSIFAFHSVKSFCLRKDKRSSFLILNGQWINFRYRSDFIKLSSPKFASNWKINLRENAKM